MPSLSDNIGTPPQVRITSTRADRATVTRSRLNGVTTGHPAALIHHPRTIPIGVNE
ncbi:hypothetical protein KGM_200033 [Danaus plexippus plexippus]|uniref:Uncharacterized protein n=1 Tax=Danaus plexippus plexippus TaxID=278856 RepID=A0A212FJC0_DANPL|nr:hypothetical protein KGM_200033 [Danaus plexippus plexippus]